MGVRGGVPGDANLEDGGAAPQIGRETRFAPEVHEAKQTSRLPGPGGYQGPRGTEMLERSAALRFALVNLKFAAADDEDLISVVRLGNVRSTQTKLREERVADVELKLLLLLRTARKRGGRNEQNNHAHREAHQ